MLAPLPRCATIDAPGRNLGRHIRQDGGDVFVRQSVEAVALNAGAADVAGQRDQFGDRRLPAMKARVEAGDLRHTGKLLGHGVNRRQVVGLVEWRQGHQRSQRGEHLRGDERGTGERRPAVHDTVTDPEHAGAAVLGAEPGRERVERGAAVVNGRLVQRMVRQGRAGTVFGREAWGRPDALNLPARFQPPVDLRPAVDAELEAR